MEITCYRDTEIKRESHFLPASTYNLARQLLALYQPFFHHRLAPAFGHADVLRITTQAEAGRAKDRVAGRERGALGVDLLTREHQVERRCRADQPRQALRPSGACDRSDAGARDREGGALPGDPQEPEEVAVEPAGRRGEQGTGTERGEELGRVAHVEAVEAVPRHADHLEGLPVQGDGAAHHVAPPSEPLLPQPVAQDGDPVLPGFVLPLNEIWEPDF